MTKAGGSAAATTAGDPAGRSASAARGLMSIGEVLAHLRTEFPDTTISKLRFLEAEGLVTPRRTPAGYRKYSWDDVSRLRYVLTAQRDQYLPLRVIRDQLAAGAAAVQPVSRPGRPLAAVPAGPGRPDAESRLSRADLLARSGLDEAVLRTAEQYGLLAPRTGGFYDADALEIATVVALLGRYGLEPRHLRGFRAAADREIGLFEQVVSPQARQRSPESRARAEESVRELAGLSLRLHAALVQAGLRGTLGT